MGGSGPQLGIAPGPGHPAGGPGNHRVGHDHLADYGLRVYFRGLSGHRRRVQIFQTFKCRGWGSILWHGLIAVLYVLAGFSIMTDPLAASTLFTLLLAGALVGIGVMRLIMAFQLRGAKNWFWPLIGGIAAIFLGFMILARWPVSGLWVIGLFVAIEMIFGGWTYIFIALGAKEIGRLKTPAAT